MWLAVSLRNTPLLLVCVGGSGRSLHKRLERYYSEMDYLIGPWMWGCLPKNHLSKLHRNYCLVLTWKIKAGNSIRNLMIIR